VELKLPITVINMLSLSEGRGEAAMSVAARSKHRSSNDHSPSLMAGIREILDLEGLHRSREEGGINSALALELTSRHALAYSFATISVIGCYGGNDIEALQAALGACEGVKGFNSTLLSGALVTPATPGQPPGTTVLGLSITDGIIIHRSTAADSHKAANDLPAVRVALHESIMDNLAIREDKTVKARRRPATNLETVFITVSPLGPDILTRVYMLAEECIHRAGTMAALSDPVEVMGAIFTIGILSDYLPLKFSDGLMLTLMNTSFRRPPQDITSVRAVPRDQRCYGAPIHITKPKLDKPIDLKVPDRVEAQDQTHFKQCACGRPYCRRRNCNGRPAATAQQTSNREVVVKSNPQKESTQIKTTPGTTGTPSSDREPTTAGTGQQNSHNSHGWRRPSNK